MQVDWIYFAVNNHWMWMVYQRKQSMISSFCRRYSFNANEHWVILGLVILIKNCIHFMLQWSSKLHSQANLLLLYFYLLIVYCIYWIITLSAIQISLQSPLMCCLYLKWFRWTKTMNQWIIEYIALMSTLPGNILYFECWKSFGNMLTNQ